MADEFIRCSDCHWTRYKKHATCPRCGCSEFYQGKSREPKKAKVAPKSKKEDHECEKCGAVGQQGMYGIGPCQICGHQNSYAPAPQQAGKGWTFTSCGCAVVAFAVFGLIIYAIFEPVETKGGSGGSYKKTYDSAMEKLNRGEELTSAERQIVNDVLNWCKICDNTMRMCKCK